MSMLPQPTVVVCRKWKEIFLPLLWHTFDEATWNAMTKRIPFYRRPVGPQEEMAKRVLQHKGQIRNLNLSSYRILYAVRMAGLTGLTSVTFDKPNHMSTKEYYNLYEVNALTISEALAKDAEDNRFDSEVPEDLFERVAEGKNMMNLTRAYWRFVLMNPGLVQLRFKIRDPRYILPLAVVSPPSGRKNSKPVTVLKPTSLAFLTNLLPSLKTMTHLEVGQNADEFLFSHIMTSLPNLKTFIHSEYSQFDSDLLLKHRHPNLQNLVFRIADLAAVQLRAIVVAFPALQTLTIPGCRITAEEIYEADIWQEIVHPLLTTVVIDDMTGPIPQDFPYGGIPRGATK
ncbi:hypothetical protein EC991_005941 [Linnemannia zychae]|nr:hypothetical protein EC991_005941 [Linnemannia zychae]